MIDFDEIIDSLRFYRRVVFFVLGLVALGLLLWLFCPRGGNPEVKAKIDEIKTTAETNTRRVEDIIDATKAKEVAAKNEAIDAYHHFWSCYQQHGVLSLRRSIFYYR